jgi:hypothetical protein
VSAVLEGILLKLLAVAPVERFGGEALKAAEALEQAVRSAGPEADRPLFEWGYVLRPRWRSPEAVKLSEERDAAARQRKEHRQAEEHKPSGGGQELVDSGQVEPRPVEEPERSQPVAKQVASRVRVRVWGIEAVVAVVGLVLAGGLGVWLYEGQRGPPSGASRERGPSAVGDSAALSPLPDRATQAPSKSVLAVGKPLPEHPLPGQRRPPCNRGSESEIRGGCWYELARSRPPCKADAYEWKGACYVPSFPAQRQPTTDPP